METRPSAQYLVINALPTKKDDTGRQRRLVGLPQLLVIAATCALLLVGCEKNDASNDNATTNDHDSGSGSSAAGRGLTPALGADAPKAGRRVAIVIGNDIYENLPQNAQLHVAVSDARQMTATLRTVEPPFAVTLLENASQNDSENALEKFIRDARDAECALVYFAGHGVEYHGSNFLLTSDTQLDPERLSSDVRRMKRIMGNEAIDLQALVDDLEATRAGVKVVILDACRDNPFDEVVSADSGGGQRSVLGGNDGGLAQVSAPSGMLIAYSADASQQANDGLFTEVLCRNIQRPGIDIVRVFAATREEVLRESRRLNSEDPQRWVVHEPAEYNKLNEAGTRFRFAGGLSEVERQLAELEKQLEDERARTSAVPTSPAVDEAAAKELAAVRAELEKLRGEQARAAASVAPVPVPAPVPVLLLSPTPKPPVQASPEPESKPAVVEMARSDLPQPALTADDSASHAAGKSGFTNSLGMTFVPVEGTDVLFSIWETRVQDYAAYAQENPGADREWKNYEYAGHKQGPDHPVVKVSWEDAKAFCVWLSKKEGKTYRLPTDHEWSGAVGIGDREDAKASPEEKDDNMNRIYPWESEWPPPSGSGNFSGAESASPYKIEGYKDGHGLTAPVGSYRAAANGLYDLSGNVYEWCEDWYNNDQKYRVGRGGSWGDGKEVSLRSSYRGDGALPSIRSSGLGFRVVVAPGSGG